MTDDILCMHWTDFDMLQRGDIHNWQTAILPSISGFTTRDAYFDMLNKEVSRAKAEGNNCGEYDLLKDYLDSLKGGGCEGLFDRRLNRRRLKRGEMDDSILIRHHTSCVDGVLIAPIIEER